MKSQNEGQHDGSVGVPPCAGEDVSGRFKRKKGHLKLLLQERERQINLPEEDASQKQKKIAGSSHWATQVEAPHDFEDDNAELSSDDEGVGDESEGNFQDTSLLSHGALRGKELHGL